MSEMQDRMIARAADARASMQMSQVAQVAYCRALERFQAACYAGDDDAAESARNELVGCVEQFTDHFAAAHRRMRDPV